MNYNSIHRASQTPAIAGTPPGPILIVPYMWIGDFVRCHSVVKLLAARWPGRPIDLLTSPLCAPLVDYMPGVRQGIVCDLPRGRLPAGKYMALARRLRAQYYDTALILPRTWKAALAPFLAGIAQRVGFVGEARFGLLNDLRWGERQLERMIDCMGALALPRGAPPPADWPPPELVVAPDERAAYLTRRRLSAPRPATVALAPGAVGRGKRWSTSHYAELARILGDRGIGVWVLGGPNEAGFARDIVQFGGAHVKDLTGTDLRDAIIALTAVDAAVTNDSGLMHVAAALGTPTIALFGPTSPQLWAPLNPLAAAIEPPGEGRCRRCGNPGCEDVRHRDVDDIAPSRVLAAVVETLAAKGFAAVRG